MRELIFTASFEFNNRIKYEIFFDQKELLIFKNGILLNPIDPTPSSYSLRFNEYYYAIASFANYVLNCGSYHTNVELEFSKAQTTNSNSIYSNFISSTIERQRYLRQKLNDVINLNKIFDYLEKNNIKPPILNLIK